jgi:hypothetical protein
MTKTAKITCDGCNNDLTHSSNCEDYRLALINESVPSLGGFVKSMIAHPAIKDDVHFCGVDCLRKWLDQNYPAAKAPYHGGKLWAKMQREHRAAASSKTKDKS